MELLQSVDMCAPEEEFIVSLTIQRHIALPREVSLPAETRLSALGDAGLNFIPITVLSETGSCSQEQLAPFPFRLPCLITGMASFFAVRGKQDLTCFSGNKYTQTLG